MADSDGHLYSSESEDYDSNTSDSDDQQPEENPPVQHECNKCPMNFRYKYLLVHHKQTVHNPLKIRINCTYGSCALNNIYFSSKQRYHQHVTRCHPNIQNDNTCLVKYGVKTKTGDFIVYHSYLHDMHNSPPNQGIAEYNYAYGKMKELI